MFKQKSYAQKGNQLRELGIAPREAIIEGRPFWPPINKRRASCAPPSTASCLGPTFTRFTYSPKPWPHAGFRIKQWIFWSVVGSGAPHRFPQVRKHRESLGPLEDHTRSEKAPVATSLCRRSPKSV